MLVHAHVRSPNLVMLVIQENLQDQYMRPPRILRSLNPVSGAGMPTLMTRSIRISSTSDEVLRSLRPRLDGALERFRVTNRINEQLKHL